MKIALVKPVVKEISVILKREPLIELRYEKTEYSDPKQNCLVKSKPYNRRGFKDLNGNEMVQRKKTDGNEEIISVKDPTNLYKSHSVTYKECKVVLERLYPHKLEKAREISQEEINALHKKKLTENVSKQMPEKRPVYLDTAKDNSKQNNDLYEFDELDTEDTSKTRQRLQKRKCNLKHISKVRKKKQKIQKSSMKINKCITYEKTVQEILQKILQKVNNGKLDVQTSTPIRQKSHFDFNVDSPPQEDNLSHMGDDNRYMHDLHNVEVNESVFEKEIGTPNNNISDIHLQQDKQPNKRIQIISDIMLDKTDYSFFLDEHLEPNANSTALFSAKSYPWRFNKILKRNPHYLNVKTNALPALQQDMVLDYNQVKKLEEHFVKTPIRLKNLKNTPNPVEVSQYIQDINDKENNPHPSLFEDDFVPEIQPKLITDYFSKNKQKRTVLGPLVENSNNIIPTTNLPGSNTVETVPLKEEVLKSTNDVNINLKKSQKNVVEQPKDKNLEPRLFEDDEPSVNFNEISKIYVPKTRKKKKILQHNVEESHQDKPKREMSKAEQVEMEKWAAKFNSLCDDIENYQLEID